MIPENWLPLDCESPSNEEVEIISFLDKFIIGQDRAKNKLAEKLVMYRHNLHDPTKPPAILLFPGPSGVGKTYMVRVFTKLLLGSLDSLLRIDCSTFDEKHSVSRLTGTSPGYLGFGGELELNQNKLDMPGFYKYGPEMTSEVKGEMKKFSLELLKFSTEGKKLIEEFDEIVNKGKPEDQEKNAKRLEELSEKLEDLNRRSEPTRKKFEDLKSQYDYKPGTYPAVVLFDEIEKMHPDGTKIFLPIFENGQLRQGDNKTVSFLNTFIFMTSNIGRDEIANELAGKSTIGIKSQDSKTKEEDLGKRVYRIVMRAIENNRSFPPEILGRMGKEEIIVFQPLSEIDMRKIIDQQLIEKLVRAGGKMLLKVGITDDVKNMIYNESQEGMSRVHGARPIGNIIQSRIIRRLANLIIKGSDGGVIKRDFIRIRTIKNKDGKSVIVIDKKENPKNIIIDES